MIKDGVVVDTSAFIAFFKGTGKYADRVTGLLESNLALITGIIIAELLQGIKNPKEEQKLLSLIVAVPAIELTTDLWVKAGKISSSLRRRGISLPITDVAIATAALEYNLSVLTLDGHFKKIPGLKLCKV
jgi:predicted nucleic acid-binding protein